jgi:hypothetical protein
MIRPKLLTKAAVFIVIICAIYSQTSNATDNIKPVYSGVPDNISSGTDYKSGGSLSSADADNGSAILLPAEQQGGDQQAAGSSASQINFVDFVEEDTVVFCAGNTIYDTVVVSDNTSGHVITLTMLSGPGGFSSTPSTSPVYGYYEYTPESGGSFEITFMAQSQTGDSAIASKTYHVFINQPPVITSGDTTIFHCYNDGSYFKAIIDAEDPDGDPLKFRLLTGNAALDSLTGELRIWPPEQGSYCFTIEVSDSCGADTAEICITAEWNTFPEINNPDQKFYLCPGDSACFAISAYDPDIDDSLVIRQTSGPGMFKMISPDSGVTCFLPDDLDSADYIFIYEATDRCLRGEIVKGGKCLWCPPIPYDTVVVTVVIGEPAILDCPGDTSIFICAPDTICFPVGAIPGDDPVQVFPPSAWYNAETQSICFYTNCTVQKDLKVVVESDCGIDSCMFTVDVTMNSAPLVMMPPDTSLFVCELSEICLPVGIGDADDNIQSVAVTPGGTYDPVTGRVCFTPEESGDHRIVVKAIDECGVEGADSIDVHVVRNTAPTVSGLNPSFDLCEPEEICFPVDINDIDGNLMAVSVTPTGYYNPDIGRVCFTPIDAGIHIINVTAADSCGALGTQAISVFVALNSPPEVVSAPDDTVFMCELGTYCFEVLVSDPDNNIASIQVTGGDYSAGYVCFTPDQGSDYTFIIEAVDECGATTADTTVITVIENSPPHVISADDFGIFQCVFDEICFDIDVSDPDNNIDIVSISGGYYKAQTGQVCFTPDTAGIYPIIVTVADSCYRSDVDTTVVTVATGDAAQITCPEGTVDKFICQQESICQPLEIFPGNAAVTVSFGTYSNGQLCFPADSAGTYIIEVVAQAECGADTCEIVFNVDIGEVPQLTCPPDTAFELCGSDEICLPIGVAPVEAIVTVSPLGAYSDGKVCFDVDTSGLYEISVKAETDCGVDSCSFKVNVSFNGPPVIISGDTTHFACESGEGLTYNTAAIDPENDEIIFNLLSPYGEIDTSLGIISFTADTAGLYCFTVVAADSCGADSTDLCISISINSPPVAELPEDEDFMLCDPEEICIPYTVSDIDGNIMQVMITGGSESNGYICLTPGSGTHLITISVTDSCNFVAADSIVLDVVINTPPDVISADDFEAVICEPEEICFDVIISDAENNIMTVSTNFGNYNSQTGEVCFVPGDPGIYKIITTISDSCYVSDADTTIVTVIFGESAKIACPFDPANVTLCGPQEFCYPLEITPSNAIVSTSFGNIAQDGQLCFFADTSGWYDITVIAEAECGADTCHFVFDVGLEEPVSVSCPPDTAMRVCDSGVICMPVSVYPVDAVVSVYPTGNYEDGLVCFYAEPPVNQKITVVAENSCSIDSCSFTVDVTLNQKPSVLTDDTTVFGCDLATVYTYDVTAHDPDGDDITFGLISSFGGIDPVTGLITFVPDSAGKYCFKVEAADSCGSDTGLICYTIDLNTPPVVVSSSDTTVIVCEFGEICIPVSVTDVNDNIEFIESSLGTYAAGEVCFTPGSDGDYYVVTTATDSCGAVDMDTTVVTIISGEPPTLSCSGDTSLFICSPDTICIPIEFFPEDAEIHVFPISAWYDADKGTVCFYTNCSVNKRLGVLVRNECGSVSCYFDVNVTMNSAPLVFLPPDTVVTPCEITEICLPAGIGDIDNNIAKIEVSSGASYDEITGKVCFTPSGAGDFTVRMRVLDSCGASDVDSVTVTVEMNSAPVVTAAPDFEEFQCDFGEVCFPVDIYDANDNIVSVDVAPFGEYDPITGKVCFTSVDIGIHDIIITVTDACGLTATDTTAVDVVLNSAPVIDLGPDTTFIVCEKGPICIPVEVMDADVNISAVTVVGADYQDGYACLESPDAGLHQLIGTVVDSCGASDEDTVWINIIINSPPVVTAAEDSTVFQCFFEEICFDVAISDPDNNIQDISTNFGSYSQPAGTVCFTPDSAGVYTIIITALDSCYEVDEDTTVISVSIGDTAEITCPIEPIDYSLCAPSTLCHPLEISPADAAVWTSYGYYDSGGGQLCFDADTSGIYVVEVIADAGCGSDTCVIEFLVEIEVPPQISCPADTFVFVCGPDTVCVLADIIPIDAGVTVLPEGVYEDGGVYFMADTTGTYSFTVIAETDCGSDTCQFNVTVAFNTPPVVDAGTAGTRYDTTYFQCEFEEIRHPILIYDVDDNIDSVVVAPEGYYDYEEGTVCFTPDDTGEYCMAVTAYDECGDTGVDTLCITVTTGASAEIDCPQEPFVERLCGPAQICLPLAVSPETAEVTVSYGVYVDGQICLYADTAGTYIIEVIASEICGADTCEVILNVEFDEYVSITCPDIPVAASLCAPGPVPILLPIEPSTAVVTVEPIGSYDFASSTLSFFADTSGYYEITVTAETQCNVEVCVVEAIVTINAPPQISCPEDFDTLMCLVEEAELCFDAEVIGAEVTVSVLPAGYYSGGMVCIPVSEAGIITTTVIASSTCGADTCDVTITVTGDAAPELTVPEDIMVPWCDDDTGQICIDGIFAVDLEGDPLTITRTCGPGTYTPIREDSGEVCFEPDNSDTTYEFCMEVTDGCSTVMKSFLVTMFPSAVCSVCVDVAIETDSCVVVGSRIPVYLTVQTNDPIGGFDLLIGYDVSVMTFIEAYQGDDIPGWEYFTYRIVDAAGCGAGCPSGLLRFIGIADENNGPFHPPQEELQPQGVIATLMIQVSNDQGIGGQYLPMNFFWIDCGDNTFSNPVGDLLYVDARIYNAFGSVIWDESDDDLFPEASRPTGLGAPDTCLTGDKISPVRCVYLHNGGICVKKPEEIDERGDVNLNGVPYEIADAVVFINYFIYGIRAFTVNPDGQMAASDVNADGFALTVADLVYLIRVIIGDAQQIPKVSPDLAELELAVQVNEQSLSIMADSRCPIGAGLLVFEYDGVTPRIPALGGLADNMDVIYSINENEIRVLIYSFERGQAISRGSGELLNIGIEGDGDIALVDYSFATYHGDDVMTRINTSLIPRELEVSQNYPNPFNPATTIELSLPSACHWDLTIYNVNGQVVRRMAGDAESGTVEVVWNGHNESGQVVSSGIYFYKVEALGQTVTKKMILLK